MSAEGNKTIVRRVYDELSTTGISSSWTSRSPRTTSIARPVVRSFMGPTDSSSSSPCTAQHFPIFTLRSTDWQVRDEHRRRYKPLPRWQGCR
jgi:hypothetical protein